MAAGASPPGKFASSGTAFKSASVNDSVWLASSLRRAATPSVATGPAVFPLHIDAPEIIVGQRNLAEHGFDRVLHEFDDAAVVLRLDLQALRLGDADH